MAKIGSPLIDVWDGEATELQGEGSCIQHGLLLVLNH